MCADSSMLAPKPIKPTATAPATTTATALDPSPANFIMQTRVVHQVFY